MKIKDMNSSLFNTNLIWITLKKCAGCPKRNVRILTLKNTAHLIKYCTPSCRRKRNIKVAYERRHAGYSESQSWLNYEREHRLDRIGHLLSPWNKNLLMRGK